MPNHSTVKVYLILLFSFEWFSKLNSKINPFSVISDYILPTASGNRVSSIAGGYKIIDNIASVYITCNLTAAINSGGIEILRGLASTLRTFSLDVIAYGNDSYSANIVGAYVYSNVIYIRNNSAIPANSGVKLIICGKYPLY